MDYSDQRRLLRFMSKVNKKSSEECWNWKGIFFKKKGLPYGQFWWGYKNNLSTRGSKTMSAHRASWIIHHGPITDKSHVLHKCHNSKCVNPNHLYLGDHMQNMRDRNEAGRTSKWDKRYNFIRTPELTNSVKELRESGVMVKDIMTKFKISRNTVYRCLGIIK